MWPLRASKQHARIDSVPPSTPITTSIGPLWWAVDGGDDAWASLLQLSNMKQIIGSRGVMVRGLFKVLCAAKSSSNSSVAVGGGGRAQKTEKIQRKD